MAEVLALIPARGGSKSVPRKNLLKLLGKPLIAYSIEHALKTDLINRVIVSTDCLEIAKVAKEFGAEVPFLRPANIAMDDSRDHDFYLHALKWLKENENYCPDYIINLRPPHPIRKIATIERAINEFLKCSDADSMRSVKVAEQTPYKMWTINAENYLNQVAYIKNDDEPYNSPRQKLPLVYWQDGYLEISRVSSVLKYKSISGKKIIPFVITEKCVDIDYKKTIPIAEEILKQGSEEEVPEEGFAPS